MNITIKEYTDSYQRWTSMLRDEAERIRKSSDAKTFIYKNVETASAPELLKVCFNCIADLTGDEGFRRQSLSALERRGEL